VQWSHKAIKKHIDSKSIILSLSNGVDNGDELRELSNSVVLDACIYILSHMEEAGIIRKNGKVFALVFGGVDEASKILKSVFAEAEAKETLKEIADVADAKGGNIFYKDSTHAKDV